MQHKCAVCEETRQWKFSEYSLAVGELCKKCWVARKERINARRERGIPNRSFKIFCSKCHIAISNQHDKEYSPG